MRLSGHGSGGADQDRFLHDLYGFIYAAEEY